MDNSKILHCLRDIAYELSNIDEPRLYKVRDRIQEQCNCIWVDVVKEDTYGAHKQNG